MSCKGIFLACKWHFLCSICPYAFIANLVISLFTTGSPMLNLPLSIPSWMLCLSCLFDYTTGTEISTALHTLNPGELMETFCYRRLRK